MKQRECRKMFLTAKKELAFFLHFCLCFNIFSVEHSSSAWSNQENRLGKRKTCVSYPNLISGFLKGAIGEFQLTSIFYCSICIFCCHNPAIFSCKIRSMVN